MKAVEWASYANLQVAVPALGYGQLLIKIVIVSLVEGGLEDTAQFLGIKILHEGLEKALISLQGCRKLNRFKSTWDKFVDCSCMDRFTSLALSVEQW